MSVDYSRSTTGTDTSVESRFNCNVINCNYIRFKERRNEIIEYLIFRDDTLKYNDINYSLCRRLSSFFFCKLAHPFVQFSN